MDAVSSYLQTQYANAESSSRANQANKSMSGISSDSSREEIEKSVKDFETYMVEQVIKNMKEAFVDNEKQEEDSQMSMYKDYFMDSAITQVASEIVDDLGGKITDDFVDQIMRNYGITEAGLDEVDSETQATAVSGSVVEKD